MRMARWRLEFQPEAERDLAKLTKSIRTRVIERLSRLEEQFDSVVPLSLTGEFREFFKARVGDWRILYKVDWGKRTLTVCYIGHRSKVYDR